jgi:hypothetical protein
MPPYTTPTHSSTSSALPSASAFLFARRDGDGPDNKVLGLALALGLLALLLFAFVVYFTLRIHRRGKLAEGWRGLSSGAKLVEPRDIASRITPFGTRDGT